MSLPDWNDLTNEARKAAVDALDYSGVDENWQGQYAMDVYNAIREHVPPEVFPLFQQPLHDLQFCAGPASSAEKPRVRVRAGRRVRGPWNTDAYALASAILEFESRLPGFWWSVGQCSVGAHASCAVDARGAQRALLGNITAGDPFDAGFDADTRGGSPAEALREVMLMALADPRIRESGGSNGGGGND